MRYDTDGAPTGKIDHMAEGESLIPEVFRKPVILKFAAAYMRQVQDLENAAWDLFTLRFLANATGDALEKWGRLVGELRNGDGDEFYRVRITVRIAVNRSRGNFGDLRRIALLIFGHDRFRIWAHRKTVAIHVFAPYATPATRTQALRWFTLAKVAGESLRLYQSVDTHPLMMVASTDSIPTLGMELSTAPGSGGRIMGEI